MTSTSPLVAGRYRLVSELGRGGMGVVWEGFDELLRRPVALKEVHFPAELPEADRARLAGRTLKEARAVAALDTPAAVRVYDIVEQQGLPWLVMELVRGTTLSTLVATQGAVAEPEVARIGLALVEALQAAHAAGVLHRDVKPSNVLLGDDGRVALTDFGIATIEGDGSDATTGVVLGSPSYVAPERLAGERPTAASDWWALGATLWTALEGRQPYDGATAYAVLAAVSTTEPPLSSLGTPRMQRLLTALMARDPRQRPDPAEVRTALLALAASPPVPTAPTTALPVAPHFDRTTVIEAPPAPAPAAPLAPRTSGRRTALLVPVVGAVLLAGVGGLLLAQHDDDPTGTTAASPRASTPPASASAAAPAPTSSAAGQAEPTEQAVAAGLQQVDGDGWTLAVPEGWTREATSSGTRFADRDGGRYVLVATRDPAGPSAVGAWEDQEKSFRSSHEGYERVRLETVEQPGASDAADWEFRYSDGGARLHALDRARVVDGVGYAVYVQSREADWADSQRLFTSVQDSFRAT